MEEEKVMSFPRWDKVHSSQNPEEPQSWDLILNPNIPDRE